MSYFASILQSHTVRIYAGSSEKVFIVHRGVLAAHSNLLKTSSRESIIELDDDEDTVALLLEYLYTSDYAAPKADHKLPPSFGHYHSPSHHDEPPPSVEPNPVLLAAMKGAIGVWGYPALPDTRHASHRSSSSATDSAHSNGNPPSNSFQTPANLHTSSAFLTHARVYALAEKYNVQALKQLSLSKLYEALDSFDESSPSQTSDIVRFIRDTYHFLGLQKDKEVGKNKSLREVISHYAAWKLDELRGSKEFDELVREGGDFVADLVAKLGTGKGENGVVGPRKGKAVLNGH